MNRLNNELKMLEKILRKNSTKESETTRKELAVFDFNAEEINPKNKYIQSENLCPPYRKWQQSNQNSRMSARKNHLR